jgi:hypothetical protein
VGTLLRFLFLILISGPYFSYKRTKSRDKIHRFCLIPPAPVAPAGFTEFICNNKRTYFGGTVCGFCPGALGAMMKSGNSCFTPLNLWGANETIVGFSFPAVFLSDFSQFPESYKE